jgi:Domain of unknown function (DUF4328)/Protein of unknown function (DUF2510)
MGGTLPSALKGRLGRCPPVCESEGVTYPTYVPYFPGAWRRNRGLANAAIALHVATALGTIPQVIALLWLRGRVDEFHDATITAQELTDATRHYFLIVSIPSVISVANMIVLIVLLWRLARNHETIGRPRTTFGPAWAIVGVVVPLLNMVVPWLFMNEKWKGSDQAHPPTSPEWKTARSSSMVNIWWAIALGAAIIGLVGSGDVAAAMFSAIGKLSRDGDLAAVAQDLVDGNLRWFVAGTLLSGVAALLGAVTLRTLVSRQESYADRFNLRHATTAPSYVMANAAAAAPAPGWFPDPAARFDHRWWDGTRWTETVSREGSTTTDPL